MAENFLDQAPVGTKVFNKENKRYYIKKRLGDRTIWKESLGSSLTAGSRDLTIDKKGSTFKYKGETIEQGDNIPDYLQNDQWTGRDKIQIKNSKYYDASDKELTGLTIGERRGEVYTIEDFNSKTGIDLKSRLAEGSEYRKYFNKNKKALQLQNEIARWERIPENKRRTVPNYATRLQDMKNDLKKLNVKPYKGESKPKVDTNKFQYQRPTGGFDEQAYNFPVGDPLASFPKEKLTISKVANQPLKIGTA